MSLPVPSIPPTPTTAAFKVVCSWCKAVLVEGDPGAPTTHSCCPDCVAKVLDDAGLPPAIPCTYCGTPSASGDCGVCALSADQVQEFVRRRLA